MRARGSPSCLPEGTTPSVARASNLFPALDPGRTYISVKILSVEVLLGMSALHKYRGISTARYSRVSGHTREPSVSPWRVAIMPGVRIFPATICVCIKDIVI